MKAWEHLLHDVDTRLT